MTTNGITKLLVDCGFQPPRIEFTKVDPRGPKYGYSQASCTSTCADPSSTAIYLTKHDSEGLFEWSCIFISADCFHAWAKDNT